MELTELRNRIRGDVMTSVDAGYEDLRRSMVWNQLVPQRRPRAIVQAAGEDDVVEAIRFARANRLKVAVRGAGHSWVGYSLHDDSLLLDLGSLNKVSIDREARIAVIQPAVHGREFSELLAAQGLAFPVGHCPTVAMSGFLLNGGLGWNFNARGPSCFSIEAARVVTADGRLIAADERQNSDLLWAVRGAGPGFFGVVTEYILRLYPAPSAITTSNYCYPLERAKEVGIWAGKVARQLPAHVELTVFVASSPSPIANRCASNMGLARILNATAFVDSADEGASTLSILNSCPVASDCLLKEPNLSTPIDALLDIGALLWPEGHRYLAATLWTNSPPGDVLATLGDHFMRAASLKSHGVLVFSTGDRSPLPDGAYSMTADALLLCYAVWERAEDDAANTDWHRTTITALERYAIGHYVGESDIIGEPRRAERSYTKSNWERLQQLRRKYDPDGLFLTHTSSS
ncbi:MAG: FAD-binding oxidoreductase [Candidatus Binataceae bacterium]